MSLFRTVDKVENKSNRYHPIDFSRNPFPRKPSITINSPDDRDNGSIYIPDLRMDEIESFRKIVVPQKDGHETKNISFLMDHATRQGRGIGKTSFLNYELKEINKDLGDEITKGSEVLFAVYCSPIPGGTYKKFYSFAKLIFRSIIDQNLLAIAACRYRVLSELVPAEILANVNEENMFETIGSSNWIAEKVYEHELFWSFNEHILSNGIKRKLEEKGVNSKLAECFARFGTSSSDFLRHYFDQLNESEWKRTGNDLLFNDLIIILREAGFTKGIILFDELEKIVQPQNSQERRSFCEELRHWFIDGGSKNTTISFFNILLVIHPYIQELLNPHWSASGLERFSSLGGHFDDQSTVFFKPIKDEQAIPLAIEYMNRSRINIDNKDSIKPFEKDALETALLKSYNVPGKFLSFLYQLIEKAIEDGWNTITKERVEQLSLIDSKENLDSDDNDNISMPESKVKL